MKLESVTVTVGHKLSRNFNTVNVELSATVTPAEGDKMPEIVDTTFRYLAAQVTKRAADELELIAPDGRR